MRAILDYLLVLLIRFSDNLHLSEQASLHCSIETTHTNYL